MPDPHKNLSPNQHHQNNEGNPKHWLQPAKLSHQASSFVIHQLSAAETAIGCLPLLPKPLAYTHTQVTQPFYSPFPGLPGWAGAKRNLLLDFTVQGKISEADTLTIPLGATPSGLINDPPPSSPIFTPDALPAATLPIYPGLGQAPNMLACIPSGVVTQTTSSDWVMQNS